MLRCRAEAVTIDAVNQLDLAALALVVVCAYKGYRTGLVGLLLGLTGGLLAFGLAAALVPLLAPLVTPFAADQLRLPALLIRSALLIVLTFTLRFLLGFAVRELTGVLRLLIRGVPPLALADRLLGVVPAAAFGGLLALAVMAVTLALPRQMGVRGLAEDSWLVRTVISRPEQTLARIRDVGARLLTDPPRVNGLVLIAGVAGLGVATVGAGRLRGQAQAAAFQGAPTRRATRATSAEVELADPLAWIRAVFGVGVALVMAAGLMLFIGTR